jgi:predicted nucleotidyltransferase
MVTSVPFAIGRPLDEASLDPPARALLVAVVSGARRVFGDRLESVALVGSRARGTARPDSDWDFLLFVADCSYDADGPLARALAGQLEVAHDIREVSLSPLSEDKLPGLDAKYPGMVDAFRRDALLVWRALPLSPGASG